MPLSEFHRGGTKAKHESTKSSDVPSYMPDQDYMELLWENGQIVMQGQSNRPKKSSSSYPTPLLSDDSLRVQDKESRDPIIQKFGHFHEINSSINELLPSVPCSNVGLNAQDDDISPWINYSIEDPFCSEFFSELAGINPNPPVSRGMKECQNLAASSGNNNNNNKARLTDCSSHQGQFQKQDLGSGSKNLQASSGNIGLMNFSHFSRPASLARVNNSNVSLDRSKGNEKVSLATASTHPMESTLVESSRAPEIRSAVNGKGNAVTNNHQNTSVVATNLRTSPDHNRVNHQSLSFSASAAVRRHEPEKCPEAMVASSVCSGNSGGAANDPKHRAKRKNQDGEDSGYNSEDLDDESTGLRKPTAGRGGTSTKRTRAAEVHNMSERRRRDRINEKMRALQELIPNCNKVDKASMLDEAIEYLKTLQLQVQMMAMGSGLCMPQMMLPAGMNPMRPLSMAHFSPMGVGMGMGMGLSYGMGMLDMNGSPGCPLIPVPSMNPSHFPYQPIPGSSGLQLFGIPGHGQGLAMPLSRAPLFSPKGPSTNDVPGTLANPLPVSDVEKAPQQVCVDSEAAQKTSNSESQAHLAQMDDKALHSNGNGAVNSIDNTAKLSDR